MATAGGVAHASVDITEASQVHAALVGANVTAVFHLAAASRSTYEPGGLAAMWRANLDGAMHVAEALLSRQPQAWLFFVSSGLVYGDKPGRTADEGEPAAPSTPYAASKYAAERALGALTGRGLKVCILRPFNHSGPGQSRDFFVPALIGRVLELEQSGARSLTLRNPNHIRDFLHVDDVARAYRDVFERRADLPQGAVFNVCSGHAVTVREIAAYALSISARPDCLLVEEEVQAAPSDVAALVGSPARLQRFLDWEPRSDWQAMVRETYAAMRAEAYRGSHPGLTR